MQNYFYGLHCLAYRDSMAGMKGKKPLKMPIEEKLKEMMPHKEFETLRDSYMLDCRRCGHEWLRRDLTKLPDHWAYAHVKPPHLITWGGRTATVSEWAREFGVNRSTIIWRLQNGWPVDRALTIIDGRQEK
jgi:hypothetical protein